MSIQYVELSRAVKHNVEQLVEALNRELELVELLRLNIAIATDHTIGRPIKVSMVELKPEENAGPHPRDW